MTRTTSAGGRLSALCAATALLLITACSAEPGVASPPAAGGNSAPVTVSSSAADSRSSAAAETSAEEDPTTFTTATSPDTTTTDPGQTRTTEDSGSPLTMAPVPLPSGDVSDPEFMGVWFTALVTGVLGEDRSQLLAEDAEACFATAFGALSPEDQQAVSDYITAVGPTFDESDQDEPELSDEGEKLISDGTGDCFGSSLGEPPSAAPASPTSSTEVSSSN